MFYTKPIPSCPVLEAEVEVTLPLTVGQLKCDGVGRPFGAHDQILLFLSFAGQLLWSSSSGVLSEERTVCSLQFAVQTVSAQSREAS
jgi:hypothetical protein